MIVKSGCMECGAGLVIDEFASAASCASCGAAHRLPRDSSGVWIATYSDEIGLDGALVRAEQIIRDELGNYRRRIHFSITEAFPLFLPVWKFRVTASGWARSGEKLVPIRVQKYFRLPAYENHERLGMPEDAPGIAAQLSPDEHFALMPLKHREADARREATRAVIEEIEKQGVSAEKGHTVFSFSDILLAVHPVWVVRFRTSGGEHFVTVDGLSGRKLNDADMHFQPATGAAPTLFGILCGGITASGIGLASLFGLHDTEIAVIASGLTLFLLTNLLRLALHSQRFDPKARSRRVSA